MIATPRATAGDIEKPYLIFNDDDITAYLKALEENLRKQIEDGKQIIL